MSAVGDAAAALTAACSQADTTGAALLGVRSQVEDARALLASAVEGSTHPAAHAALAHIDTALSDVAAAVTLLDTAATALRGYATDVLKVGTGGAPASGGAEPVQVGAAVTRPSRPPDASARPRGRPTPTKNPEPDTARSLRRENEAAIVLARLGYHVVQNPPPKPNGKKPDYLVEGRYFDCYAPTNARARNIWSALDQKAHDDQADRLVVNLADTPIDRDELRLQFRTWPPAHAREIIVVDGGRVWHLFPEGA